MSQIFIFWLFDWNVVEVSPMIQLHSRYLCCTVTPEEVRIEEKSNPFVIPLSHITDCELMSVYQGRAPRTPNIRMKLRAEDKISTGWYTRNEIYLVHELRGDFEDFVTVVNAYRQGLEPDLNPNPYYRELKRQGQLSEFSEEKWKANTPPFVYFPPPTMRRILYNVVIFIAIVLIAGALATGFIILLDYLFDI